MFNFGEDAAREADAYMAHHDKDEKMLHKEIEDAVMATEHRTLTLYERHILAWAAGVKLEEKNERT